MKKLMIMFFLLFIFSEVTGMKIGREFIFMEKQSKKDYPYFRKDCKDSTGLCDIELSYTKYVGMKGKIIDTYHYTSSLIYWKIKLENEEIVYYSKRLRSLIEDIYFIDNYNEAKKLIGKYIWINQNEWKNRKQRLVTKKIQISYPLDHLEKVKVKDIYLGKIRHPYGSNGLFLIVEKENGATGFKWYNNENFFSREIFNPKWPTRDMKKIKEQKVWIGMTKNQALVSWGEPNKINTTIMSTGRDEQWVYGSQYLYFENGILRTIQSF